jgi:hypothetical protein
VQDDGVPLLEHQHSNGVAPSKLIFEEKAESIASEPGGMQGCPLQD